MSVKNVNEHLDKASNVLKQMKKDAQTVGANLTGTEQKLNEIVGHLVDAHVETLNELGAVSKRLKNIEDRFSSGAKTGF